MLISTVVPVRRIVLCFLLLLSAAGCSQDSALDEAARVLAADGAKIAKSRPMENQQISDQTGKGHDDANGCAKGTARRTYRITGGFSQKGMSPEELVDYTAPLWTAVVESLGYVADSGTSVPEQAGRVIDVLRKNDPEITFTVTVQSAAPNVEIVGKTACLAVG